MRPEHASEQKHCWDIRGGALAARTDQQQSREAYNSFGSWNSSQRGPGYEEAGEQGSAHTCRSAPDWTSIWESIELQPCVSGICVKTAAANFSHGSVVIIDDELWLPVLVLGAG